MDGRNEDVGFSWVEESTGQLSVPKRNQDVGFSWVKETTGQLSFPKRNEDVGFTWVEETTGQLSVPMRNEVGIPWVEETTGQLSVPKKLKRKVRPKKMEFVGWGSKPLIQFLQSIGKDTGKPLNRFEVTAIINEYVKVNNLIKPEKKKRIQCDEKLHFLFGKKSVPRLKVHDLLEPHFVENQDDSDEDFGYSSDEKEENIGKEHNTAPSDRKVIHQKKKVLETPKSCFAALINENIKHVYLKRTVVQGLVKCPETFEAKLVGSFVRIKSDPYDLSQTNSHMLVQVTGVKNVSAAGSSSTEILLQASNFFNDIHISMLSDANFTEDECENLRQRVKSGLFRKPTVVELEQKAQMLHEDIIKHWLVKEIDLLQNLIDRANEKGWRRELFEYLDRKQLLQTPSEQSRLLSEIPSIIAEEIETEATTVALHADGDFPQGNLIGSPDSAVIGTQINLATQNHGVKAAAGDQQPADIVQDHRSSPSLNGAEMQLATYEDNMVVLELPANNQVAAATEVILLSDELPPVKNVAPAHVIVLSSDDDNDDEVNDNNGGVGGNNGEVNGNNGGDDDNDDDEVDGNNGDIGGYSTEAETWLYLDPLGEVQGPFSLRILKGWYDNEYFDADFKVWSMGQCREEAVLLRELLRSLFLD